MDVIKATFSSPIDAGTNEEIKELIKSVLATFTTHYVKQYALALVKKGIDDASAEEGPTWKLSKRPPRETAFKEGWVIKEAGYFVRTMEKRYFVVKPDYMIDYYVTEAEAKKPGGKKKGTISLCGYSVNDDANNGPMQRLIKLAERMGVDVTGLPKPKEYPKNTMELYHNRRESFYVHLEDDDEFKQWLQQMKTCAWRAYGLKNKEEVHVSAFREAINQTRYKLGRWGYSSYSGTEEQILSDLISDELDYDIMGRIYSKIQGPWALRSRIRDQVLKVIDKLVLAAVTPAWAAMSQTVEKLRPEIEPKINQLVGPIGEAKKDISNKIKAACMSIIDPTLKEHVIPHLSKIIDVIQKPMEDAFTESYRLYDKEVFDQFSLKDVPDDKYQSEFSKLDWFPYSWKMYEATRIADAMYDPLWALNVIFREIYPWSLIWTAHDTIRSTMDDAIYTFETRVVNDKHKSTDDVKHEVLEDYKTDGKQAVVLYHLDIIKKIVMPPFSSVLFPAVEAILSPLDSAIPDPMKQFIDINDMFQNIVVGVIDETIKSTLSK